MEYYDFENENYYEPTVAEELLNEAVEKFKGAIKEDIKINLEYIQDENKRLKKENKELKIKSREVDNKEQQLERKEKDLERTFYRSTFSKLLKPLEENMEVWYADYSYKKVKKCKLCDDDRKIIFTSTKGKEIKQNCECDKDYRYYTPKKTTISVINLYKKYDYNNSEFSLSPKYHNNRNDDERWLEFEIK